MKKTPLSRRQRFPRIATAIALAGAVLAPAIAEARITRIEIDAMKSESPTFGGYAWPKVGQYEKIVGKAYGEVNPHDRQNRIIVDIEYAPRNPRGNVEYAFNFYILKPIDLSKGAGRMMYEPPNRGGKTWAALGRVTVPQGANGDDPGSVITDPAVLANSFLMPRGYTIAWSGWEDLDSLDNPDFNATATLPIARFPPTPANPTGTITGPSYEYIVVTGTAVSSVALSYPAATLDKTQATLTHRVHLNDAPQVIPASGWDYNADGTAISLAGGNFVANDIYEFAYTAKDPKVNGLGFAAVRDWMEFLRYKTRDDHNNRNPLARHIKRVYTEISSQPGRLLNDFRHLGFNETESGRKAFDGHMQWIAAGNGINMNYRFSQSGRTERNRQQHLFIEGRFPFANVTTYDPITRKIDSRYASCQKTKTCPLGMEIYSANEYWVKTASLLHTTPDGTRDLPDSKYTRNYFMSSMRHGTGNAGTDAAPNRGLCQQRDNPLNSAPVQRALFIALDEWATEGRKPPRSRVPKLRDGTLVPPLPQSGMGFPNIPSTFEDTPGPFVTYTGLKTTRYHFDYGPNFYETGIATVNPPVFPFTTPSYQDDPRNGPIYPSFIPKTDRDGNDIAGVRLADVTVPLATYTGWALRRGVHANDGCEAAGQFIPFARSEADRVASGDPRRSVAARYPTFAAYHAKVRRALNDMVSDRLLLCEDAGTEEARLMQAGLTRGVPQPAGDVLPALRPLPACEPRKGGHGHHHDKDHDEHHDNDRDDDKRRH
jgi:Alpha/beta hydrolase domain